MHLIARFKPQIVTQTDARISDPMFFCALMMSSFYFLYFVVAFPVDVLD